MARALFCAILTVCALLLPNANAAGSFVPTEGMDGSYIGWYAGHLEDKTKTLTIEDVRSDNIRAKFTPTNSDTPFYGLSKSSHWLHFSSRNPTGEKIRWILQAEHSQLKNIEVYEIGGDGKIRVHVGGTENAFSSRDIGARKNAFQMETRPGESEFFVRFSTKSIATANCTLTAWGAGAFIAENNYETILFGMYYGALLSMLVYNLFIFFTLRDYSYLWYCLYIFFATVSYLHINGYAIQYVYPKLPETDFFIFLRGMGSFSFGFLATVFATAFARAFLQTKKSIPAVHNLLTYLLCLLVVFSLFIFSEATFGITLMVVGYYLTIFYSIVLFYAGTRSFLAGVRQTRFFLAAWTIYLLGISVYILRDFGVLGYSFITTYSMQGGTLADVLLLSFALGDRINIVMEEKEKAQSQVIEQEKRALASAEESRDQLEKKVVERTAALATSEERFRKLSDSTYEALIITENGVALDVNKAYMDMTGYARSEIIGKNAVDLFVVPEHRSIAMQKITERSEEPYEISGIRKDGRVLSVEVRGSSLEFHGKPARVTAIRDITEKKLGQAALISAKETAENATKLKDKFVGIVAHDLRSPLAGMAMLLKVVTQDKKKPLDPAKKDILEKVLTACDQMFGSLNNLLDLNRFQTGRLVPHKKRFSVHLLTDQKIDALRPVADGKGLTLKNDLPADFKMLGDGVLLGECLSNLLSNAVKFCNTGGEISVFSPEGKPTVLAVKDNGIGMSSKLISNLFNPSVKKFSTGTGGESGTGLGLIYCHEIMAAHGGSISVESEVGKGSVFYLALPDAKPVVLVVDDEPLARMMAKEILSELDVEIIEAEDGLVALEALKTRPPHLIVLDVNMPRMNGIEFLTEFHGLNRSVGVSIIATTGDTAMKVDGMDVRSYMLQNGCDDFANKPFSPHDLAPRVRKLIEG